MPINGINLLKTFQVLCEAIPINKLSNLLKAATHFSIVKNYEKKIKEFALQLIFEYKCGIRKEKSEK